MKIRKNLISWLKDKIKNTVRETGYTLSYLPYNPSVNDYVIAKTNVDYPKCGQGISIPPVELRSGYAANSDEYVKSGKEDIDNMMGILKSSGYVVKNGSRILDFGCSSGRMIRHLKQYADSSEIWGAEVSVDHTYWNNKYLNPPFHFLTSTFNPYLPFENRYFDLIYSGSVFTHIDNLIESWLLELKRILADDGLLYITIHDNHTLDLFKNATQLPFADYINNHYMFEKAKKDFNFFVFNRSNSPQVFFDLDYFKKLVDPIFEIVSVNNESYGYQTGVLLRRKTRAV